MSETDLLHQMSTASWIAFWVVFGVQALILGFVCAHLAERKGLSANWFWAGFGLGVVGLVWVGFLPPQPQPTTCHQCGGQVNPHSTYCPSCGTREWRATCDRCHGRVGPNDRYCLHCGAACEGEVSGDTPAAVNEGQAATKDEP